MLVSSIGYLNAVKSAYNDDLIKVQTSKNAGLSGGFGHYNECSKVNETKPNALTKLAKAVAALFSNKKADESCKSLSLIA